MECRMTPLSKSYQAWSSHTIYIALYDDGKTVDENLEQINFQKAGEALVHVWSKTLIVSHATHTKFVKNEKVSVKGVDEEW